MQVDNDDFLRFQSNFNFVKHFVFHQQVVSSYRFVKGVVH